MPAIENLRFKPGDDKIFTITVDPSDLEDLDDATVTWWLSRLPTSTPESALIEKTIGDGITIVSAEERVFSVELSRDDTLGLSGKYYHQAAVEDESGHWSTVTTGMVVFDPWLASGVTVEQANAHLRTGFDMTKVNIGEEVADLVDKLMQAEAIVLDYLKVDLDDSPAWEPTARQEPVVQAAVLLILSGLYDDRDGSVADYLASSGAVARLLMRMRDPAFA